MNATPSKQTPSGGSDHRLVRRAAFVCKYCEGIYADDPVTQCDCLGATDQDPPHFIKGKIEYRLPNKYVFDK